MKVTAEVARQIMTGRFNHSFGIAPEGMTIGQLKAVCTERWNIASNTMRRMKRDELIALAKTGELK